MATFQAYHIMVWLGVLFVVLTLVGLYFRWKGTIFEKRWLLWVFVLAVPLPYIANQFGWITAEVGRQPWVVYGLLRTSDALSKAVGANEVLGSIIMFIVIYALLFVVWVYVLDSKIKQGPEEIVTPPAGTTPGGFLGVAGLRAGVGGASLTETDDKRKKD
jgi:cytochrome bd ubiquinol oxidase subunit I